ncbi:hypothetical protein RFI_27544 [Reticulomyxa filosa]|uniref:Uncharacterized protein n=1 Tax=Reticulomyxa filosa TaxID=46433 RepID=X6M7C6_RETFI|nr:hypothetical protein RFI_27544 [Reticulomyxa filosa]|eukprot:ETO09834.1 hypothetical protein RFI_27544 [Reticulomyxa filosa]
MFILGKESSYDKKSKMEWFEVSFFKLSFYCFAITKNKNKVKCNGGMQDDHSGQNTIHEEERKFAKEIKTLIRLFGDSINKGELQQKIEHHNGNIELVIKDLVQQSIEQEKQEQGNAVNETNANNKSIQKETEETEIGEIKPGINLQGYCTNETCLAAKEKLPVWVNIGFGEITFISEKKKLDCPDCKKTTVVSIIKAMFYNCEYSICTNDNNNGNIIPIKDNNYQNNMQKV